MPIESDDPNPPRRSPLQRDRIALAIVGATEELRVDFDPHTQILTISVNRDVSIIKDQVEMRRDTVMISPEQQPQLVHILLHVLGLEA